MVALLALSVEAMAVLLVLPVGETALYNVKIAKAPGIHNALIA